MTTFVKDTTWKKPINVQVKDNGSWVDTAVFVNDSGTWKIAYGLFENIELASYESKSYDVTSEDRYVEGIFIKSDGLKLFVLGDDNNKVYQYTLSTAWDISSASYDSKSFDFSAKETSPTDLFFKSDGTEMYIIGFSSDHINQYALGTAWDVSTAAFRQAYDQEAIVHETVPQGLSFGDTGSKMYIVGTTNDTVYQFDLGTAWDVSTASDSGNSLDISSQTLQSRSLFFSPFGDRFFIPDDFANKIYQYNMTTDWDLSTASYSGQSFAVTSQTTAPTGLFFDSGGEKMYVVGNTLDKIYQYGL